MKKPVLTVLLIAICIFAFAACDNAGGDVIETTSAPHVCSFGEWTEVSAATCTEAGLRERACACGEKQTETLAATGHTEAVIEAVEPTCTASGLTESKYCSVCDQILVEPEFIEPLGHDIEDGGFCSVCDKPVAPSTCIEYEISEDKSYVTVTGYTGEANRVFIGDEYEGVPVTKIADRAFAGAGLVDVVIPESVIFVGRDAFTDCFELFENVDGVIYVDAIVISCKEEITETELKEGTRVIADYAFINCRNLKKAILPDSVKTIGNYAFENCNGLEAVITGEASELSFIGEYCFRYCFSFTAFNIPDSVTVIGAGAFYCCQKLADISIPEGLTVVAPYTFYECYALTSLVIPEGVTSIGDGAFNSCKHLETVNVADSVKEIGGGAFSTGNVDISALRSVTFGENSRLTSIGYGAFDGCYALESIVIPKGVTSLDSDVFNGCTGLRSVTFLSNSTITSIGDRAFYFCQSLETIDIPLSVTSIGEEAFYACDLIERIVIPESVTSIGKYAFGSTYGSEKALCSVTFGENSQLTSIGEGAFFMCKNLNSIVIPESVEVIGETAFNACTSLESVVIPGGVSTIGRGAFWYCTALKNVTILDGVTVIGESSFYDCPELESVSIPVSVVTIETFAFDACNKLETIIYGGTMAQWNEIDIKEAEYTFVSEYTVLCKDGSIVK